ncbi:hypothetical protein [Methylobacterium sp. WL8]|uniref:hypothetical protein n=1 Tax=Methylobacterium sp. WL8 TaxID=2603899 RepID=UPI0011CB8AD2|nr:hypothetical protein [Methylobacterium sp. WL8]TXN79225.1 hypothetical protein FV234_21215 [Methylobacterium sp. WL8]
MRYRASEPPGRRRSALQRQMRQFLRQGTEHGLVALLEEFDARRTRQGRSARAVVGDLYRITARLLEPGAPRKAGELPGNIDGMAAPGDVVLWAALVLAWQPVLEDVLDVEASYRRGPDRLESTLYALGHDFLDRRAIRTADPLDSRWSGISRALEAFIVQATDRPNDDEDRSEVNAYKTWVSNGDLVQTLADTLGAKRDAGPWWVRHLHVGLMAAQAITDTPAGAVPQSRTPVDVTTLRLPVRRFCDVVGRGGAVHALRRHVLDDDGANVLLYGPDGVGRRTLAHLLAKARLCEASDRALAPCDACPSCKGYENGAFGQFWIDGADREGRKRVTKYIVEALPVTGFSRCRTVVIENADHYPSDLFDQSLQSMEIDHGATFILLARNRDAVRVAGRSRCHDYRVRPLTPGESLTFLAEIAGGYGMARDETLFALLAQAGEGLPGRLHALCRRIAAHGERKMHAVNRLLEPVWLAALLATWPELVAETPTAVGELMRAAAGDRRAQAARVQAALVAAGLSRRDCTEAALTEPFDKRIAGKLRTALENRARSEGTTFETVWRRMSKAWLAERYAHDWRLQR